MAESGETPGDPWVEALARLTEAQRAAAAALGPDAQDAMWTAFESQLDLWRSHARVAASGAASAPGAETLARFLDPAPWLLPGGEALDPALRKLIDGPPPSRETAAEWLALRRARAQARKLLARAWRKALAAVLVDDDAVEDPTRAQKLWVAAAAREVDALQRSAAYLKAQRALLVAATALREAEAARSEAEALARGEPTRRELDDLHRTVTELRREVRALRRGRDGG
jgi:hypothetical protein